MRDKIKVGGVEYKIKQKQFVEIDEDRNYQGCCDYRRTEIQVLDSLSNERKEDVMWHELTHAIFYEAGFEDQDEDMVNRVAKVMAQVVKDNFD